MKIKNRTKYTINISIDNDDYRIKAQEPSKCDALKRKNIKPRETIRLDIRVEDKGLKQKNDMLITGIQHKGISVSSGITSLNERSQQIIITNKYNKMLTIMTKQKISKCFNIKNIKIEK